MNVRLYTLQRLTAALMVPLIFVHIITIVYAIGNGLTAKEILARTQGDLGWALFYAAFVLAAAVHGAIGVRTVLIEWTRMRSSSADIAMWIIGIVLTVLGLRAVIAVVL